MVTYSKTQALAIELPPNTGCNKTDVNQNDRFCLLLSKKLGLYLATHSIIDQYDS